MVEERARERAMGERLEAARVAAGLSIRRASKVSGVPAVQWADMERGEQANPPGPVDAPDVIVARAAQAVGLDPAELFDLLGRAVPPDLARTGVSSDDLAGRVRRLEAIVAVLAEQAGIDPSTLD